MSPDPMHEDACPKRRLMVESPWVLAALGDYHEYEKGWHRGTSSCIGDQPHRWLEAMRVIAAECAALDKARLKRGDQKAQKDRPQH